VTAGDDRPTDVLAELAEAEAAEADARAEADRAKARAATLRAPDPDVPDTDAADTDATDPDVTPGTRRWGVLSWRNGAVAGTALLIGAGLTLTALMLGNHAQVAADRAQDRASVEAARNGVMALLSIDHTRAKQDVQRVLDLSTGRFREDFASDADDFVKTAIDSQAVTKGSVSVAALQSVRDDSGVVLVAASSKVTNASGAKEDTRPWRMRVTVTRDGDIWKMSDVEFVP
jgi:Mce-associated membrane protein